MLLLVAYNARGVPRRFKLARRTIQHIVSYLLKNKRPPVLRLYADKQGAASRAERSARGRPQLNVCVL